MKILTILFALILQTSLQGQTIEPAPADKSVVYFVRANGYGSWIDFTYFDGDKVIGLYNQRGYFRYECDPGEHFFWAHAENNDYVNANLEAGKIYVIEAVPILGFILPGVMLTPVNSSDYDTKKIKKMFRKEREYKTITDEGMVRLQDRYDRIIEGGLVRSKKEKAKAKTEYLGNFTLTSEDLVTENSK